MSSVLQFLQFNLLPSLVGGLVVWILVLVGVWALRIDYGSLRLSLLYAPAVKSLLVLIGVSAIFPWPPLFSEWRALAVPPSQVLPWLLLWLGLGLILKRRFLQGREPQILGAADPAEEHEPRLVESLERAQRQLRACPVEATGEVVCCLNRDPADPEMLVHDGISSPFAMERQEGPAIVFPADLVSQLTDGELDHAVAHELAHLTLRSPAWCSPRVVRHLSGVAPVAHLLGTTLKYEEEKACDDMAIAALGRPEVFADMLLKSYRFARARKGPWARTLRALPQLLGARPGISDRVERLIGEPAPDGNLRLQAVATCLMWTGLIIFTF